MSCDGHLILIQVSILSKTIPLGHTPGTRLAESKSGPSPWDKTGKSKAPPQSKCIHKLLTLSERKALLSQQIKWPFNDETDC